MSLGIKMGKIKYKEAMKNKCLEAYTDKGIVKIELSEKAEQELTDLRKELGIGSIAETIIGREPLSSFLAYELENCKDHKDKTKLIQGARSQSYKEGMKKVFDEIYDIFPDKFEDVVTQRLFHKFLNIKKEQMEKAKESGLRLI